MIKLNKHGETIVEVIISIAVVSSVLSGAYYLISRSTRQSQAAVERVAAAKAAESKAELLRNLPTLELGKIDTNKWCISSATAVAFNNSNAYCYIDRYEVTVTKNGLNYQITAVWDGLIANKETVTIYYRP